MKVKLTENAEKTFLQIISRYSNLKATKFSNQTISTIEIIVQNNFIGSKYKKTTYRKFPISNQVFLFYQIEKQIIYIVLFWDNKRNPLELDSILSS
ncbi:type II toxin-antitoxin system RelE/ParE family toxin [Flavobacterium luteolum]|uniref:type II toxin-antitoxin system RelE/ParE family toxin n=1 Tax=Flavobacterium luteolum TaxID=3003259 RepID=UPI00248EE950|nr:hypothetical protein [Flavobacterium luteolum]